MQNSHFWNCLHLHRQKNTLCCLALLCLLSATGFSAKAQNWFEAQNKGRSYTDKASPKIKRSKGRLTRPLAFGFFVAPVFTKYGIKYTDEFATFQPTAANDFLTINSAKPAPGFSLGFYSNIRLAEYWDFRIHANAAFYERKIEYTTLDGTLTTKVVESPVVELPILIKYRSQLRGIAGMYMIAGIKPAFALSSKSEDNENVEIKSMDLSVEYGLGFDIFFSFFKFAPELRFSHGILNTIKKGNDNIYSSPLQRLNTHTMTLYLHFGG